MISTELKDLKIHPIFYKKDGSKSEFKHEAYHCLTHFFEAANAFNLLDKLDDNFTLPPNVMP